jgi:cobalamin-dependent methionine synthase I
MTRQKLDIPVILGGAALTRQYVETDCAKAYGSCPVAYARDAFETAKRPRPGRSTSARSAFAGAT